MHNCRHCKRPAAFEDSEGPICPDCADEYGYASETIKIQKMDRIYRMRQMPPDTAPKGVPVLVAGGIAMRKTGGEWFSGMCEPAFSRELNWTPEWWAAIPQQNDPLPEG